MTAAKHSDKRERLVDAARDLFHRRGYGETSLLYDRQDELVVHSLDDVTAGRVWLVGKTGEHDYYQNVPSNWQLVQRLEAGDSVVQLYENRR